MRQLPHAWISSRGLVMALLLTSPCAAWTQDGAPSTARAITPSAVSPGKAPGITGPSSVASERPTLETIASIEYHPPLGLGASVQRVGGAPRALGGERVRLEVLAPEGLGLTASAQPRLYWFSSGAPGERVLFTLTADGRVDPLLELDLAPPSGPGVQAVSLASLAGPLEPGLLYRWEVAVVVDAQDRSRDVYAGAALRHVAVSPELGARLDAATALERARLYAAHGYWYDALAALSNGEAGPDEAPTLRAHRQTLLEDAGLSAVAAHDAAPG
jgi:hypothetical protein